MPSVKKGESEKDYVKRCIPYVIKNEGLSSDEAAAKCHGMYKQHSKTGKQYSNIVLYEEGMEIEEERYYAFKFDGFFGNSDDISKTKSISFTERTGQKGYTATIVVGNRFMKGIFVQAKELEKVYKQWDNTLHDLNHFGSGYQSLFSTVPSDISYIVGYQDNAKFNIATKEVTVDVHIDKNAPRFSEWESYMNICKKINRMPNVSMYCFGKIKYFKAKDLPKDSRLGNNFSEDESVPCLVDMIPFMVSTVLRGACNDKDGCGITRNSDQECNTCKDNICDVGATLQTDQKDNPEILKRKDYLNKRIKSLRGK